MRLSSEIPETNQLVSKTWPPGHTFPYSNATLLETACWYWSVLRFKKRSLDWFWDPASFSLAIRKMDKVFEVLGDWTKVVQYIQWFIDQDSDYTATTKWDFNYLISGHAINKYLGNAPLVEDAEYWQNYNIALQARELIMAEETNARQAEIKRRQRITEQLVKEDYAAKIGTDSAAIRKPFEKNENSD